MQRDHSFSTDVSIVLPCFNEVRAVGPVLDRIAQLSPTWSREGLRLCEVIVVDDGSTDRTREAVLRWQNRRRQLLVKVISHHVRRGYGAALKTGIAAADGQLIAFYDVDGTYDPLQIPAMVRAMNQARAEMVCGDRLSNCRHMPLTREIGNRLFVAMINLLFRTRVVDSCTGMRVFTRELQQFFSSDALPNGLDYSLAMTLSFLRAGRRLVETPIPYARRIGRSKLSVLADGPRFFLRIVGSWLRNPISEKTVPGEVLESWVVREG